MTLIATRSYVYNDVLLQAGQAFEPVSDAHAQLLILVGSAKAGDAPAPPKKRRRYARKDLTAAHGV